MALVFHSVRTTAPGVPLVPKPPGPDTCRPAQEPLSTKLVAGDPWSIPSAGLESPPPHTTIPLLPEVSAMPTTRREMLTALGAVAVGQALLADAVAQERNPAALVEDRS